MEKSAWRSPWQAAGSEGKVGGSAFHFTACFARGIPAGAPPETVAATVERPSRILLAEDNAVNRRLACHLLEKKRHTVITARNGRDALAVLATETVDLILMDVQMPGNGRSRGDARHPARETAGGLHAPIVALSAARDERRSRLLPGCRHGRLPDQADSGGGPVPRAGLRGSGCLTERVRRGR